METAFEIVFITRSRAWCGRPVGGNEWRQLRDHLLELESDLVLKDAVCKTFGLPPNSSVELVKLPPAYHLPKPNPPHERNNP